MKIPLDGFDSCLSVKFSYLQEYAGLYEDGSPDVLVGKLYGKDGTENMDSRVSASFESASNFFVSKILPKQLNTKRDKKHSSGNSENSFCND